jgi:microsomal dipeptidase-like Zn-dependent dipeptidase
VLDLLRAAPLIDGHNDLLWELRQGKDPADPTLMTDLARMAAGGVGGQFWSVYVPSDLPADAAVTMSLEQIDALLDMVRRNPDRLEFARSADDVERIAAAGRVASMIGVEGGHSIGGSLGTLRVMAELGMGYLTLTHNDDTPWADSATGDHPHGGLTRFGEEVVREVNRCGWLVDLSHTSDDTMRQAIEVSEAPVIFSHSSARALCDVPRNVPDDVLELVGRTDGVVMVTFVPSFVVAEGAEFNQVFWAESRRVRAEHPNDPEGRQNGDGCVVRGEPGPAGHRVRCGRPHRSRPRRGRDRPRRYRERLRRRADHAPMARGRVALPGAVRRAGEPRLPRRGSHEDSRPKRALGHARGRTGGGPIAHRTPAVEGDDRGAGRRLRVPSLGEISSQGTRK